MSETQKLTTLEKPPIDPALKAEELSLEAGRTTITVGGVEELPGHGELGDTEFAHELHEANLDWATALGTDVDALLGDKSSIESPGFSASRVEIPRPTSESGDPGFRYDLQMTEGKQSRTNVTVTVMDGRPELTFHTEPLDTEKYPATRGSLHYRNGSWAPEEVGSNTSETEWNTVFTQVGESLKRAHVESKELEGRKNRSLSRRALDAYMSIGEKK